MTLRIAFTTEFQKSKSHHFIRTFLETINQIGTTYFECICRIISNAFVFSFNTCILRSFYRSNHHLWPKSCHIFWQKNFLFSPIFTHELTQASVMDIIELFFYREKPNEMVLLERYDFFKKSSQVFTTEQKIHQNNWIIDVIAFKALNVQ